MPDYSWIKPATQNIANLFGLNPQAAAEGRRMQAEQEFLAARTRNTDADTGLSDYRRRVLEAQAAAQGALGGKYGAETTFTGSKTRAQDLKNQSLARLFEAGSKATKNIVGPDGKTYSLVDQDEVMKTVNPADIMIALGSSATDAEKALSTREARRNITSGDAEKVRTGAILSGQATAAGNPEFAANNQIAQGIRKEGYDAAEKRTIAGATARAATSGGAVAPGQPDQMDLNRAAEAAVNVGPNYFKMRYSEGGYQMPDDVAFTVSSAAQKRYPDMPINQAIDRIISESGLTFDDNWELVGSNRMDPKAGGKDVSSSDIAELFGALPPIASPAAPAAAAPTASAAPKAPTIPPLIARPQAAAPAPGKSLFKQDVAAMPDGSVFVYQGQQYRKQGGQLMKVK